MADQLNVGGVELRLPAGFTAMLLGSDEERSAVRGYVLESPDHTLYHLEPYFEYARRDPEGGPGDLALVIQNGNPVFGLPLHVRPGRRMVTGYSGVLLPPGDKEATLGRSVRALGAFIAANPGLSFEGIQSAQAMAYDDSRRMSLIRRFLAELDLTTRPVFTRVLRLHEPVAIEEAPGSFAASSTIAPSSLDNGILGRYDGDARNQIRQALRSGLSVDVFLGDRDRATTSAYELIQPLHDATWARSGWSPHPIQYWLALSEAVNRSEGASDLVVTVRGPDSILLAAVVCHRYRDRALYWSGCSTDGAGPARANPLCLHAAISVCSATGVELFEVGRFDARERSDKERAVTRYKAQFRGDLLEVVNFSRLTTQARIAIMGDRLRGRVGALAQRARP
jgi:hypothetical protein